MATYMPPIARKMKVPEKYNPDTFRVLGENAELFHTKFPDAIIKPVYASDPRPARKLLPNVPIRETRVLPYPTDDFRANKPQPRSCGFLRHNARYFNEPICTVYTQSTHPEQHSWWPARKNPEPPKIPGYTRDTLYRQDYQFDKVEFPTGSKRHTANPNTEPALGTIPVNFLQKYSPSHQLYQENVSFEHQYNSRSDPNYPPRLKRHGAFVWHQLQPDKTQLLLDYRKSVDSRSQIEKQIAKKAREETEQASSHLRPIPQTDLPFAHIIPAMGPQPTWYPAPELPTGPPSPPTWPYPADAGLKEVARTDSGPTSLEEILKAALPARHALKEVARTDSGPTSLEEILKAAQPARHAMECTDMM